MSEPLVLYLSDPTRPVESLDAEVTKALLLERRPGADVLAVRADYDSDDVPATVFGHVWCISVPAPRWAEDGVRCTHISPTPDVSMAMQAWRMQNGFGHAPCWLRYLDDAVCERWALPLSEDVWTCLMSYETRDALVLLRSWDDERDRLVWEGRAILRARKRWEAELRASIASEDRALLDGSHDALARLCRERDQLRAGLSEAEARTNEACEAGQRLLGEALRHVCHNGRSPAPLMSQRRYVELCKIAGVDP